jgi:hypothetical protein
MKNIYDVIKQKETQLARLQKELETLRYAAKLLDDDAENADEVTVRSAMVANGTVVPQSRPATVKREAAPAWGETGLRQFP